MMLSALAAISVRARESLNHENAKDYKHEVALNSKAAEQGDANAQYNLGSMYFDVRGVSQDYKQAVAWYRKAAEQGHAKAQLNIGFMYANGIGVSQDYKQAVAWYRKAAEQGNAKWLITSCRSANNIMPITVFLPAFIASFFYSA
ncbi:sel1 repeat family protein [Aeromonas veronii]|nr:sel1 repeat family protein [Aeromonas veronii]